MKKEILFLLLLTMLLSCKKSGQKTLAASVQEASIMEDSISKRAITVGIPENYEVLPRLKFEQITKEEFLPLEEEASFEPFIPKYEEDFFFIPTKLKEYKFKKYQYYNDKKSWYGNELLYYYPTLKLYAITENTPLKV